MSLRTRAFPVALPLAVLLMVGALATMVRAARGPDQPNVVVVLVDDLGWSDLGCQGHEFHRTPNIDALAGSGVRLSDFYAAAPVCSPTRASLWSGMAPARLGLTDFVPGHWRRFERLEVPVIEGGLPTSVVTPAESLAAVGYRCAYFGKWHLGEGAQHPSRQGFTTAFTTSGRHFAPDFRTRPAQDVEDGAALADVLTDHALRFIEEAGEQPFFVVVSHFAVHIPLEAEAEAVAPYEERLQQEALRREDGGGWMRFSDGSERFCQPSYAALLESVDRNLGRLVEGLEARGLREDTLLLFTSDNGGLHRIYTGVGARATDNAPLRGEKGSLYEGGIRVPFIASMPGTLPAGVVRDTPAISMDLAPTLIATAAAPAPTQACDGTSLWDTLRHGTAPARESLYFHYPHYHHDRPAGAIRSGRWKLLERLDSGAVELYDLREDLGESRDLSAERPELAESLRQQLAGWREAVGARMPEPNPQHDPGRAGEWWSRGSSRPVDIERQAEHYRVRIRGAAAEEDAPLAAAPQPSAVSPSTSPALARSPQDASAVSEAAAETPPNVVLIISDDQHWGDYSFLGHPHVRTPRIDRLASQGLCFTRGYVPSSLCCPSLASMVTGLQPHVHRITGNEPPGRRGTPEYRAACEEMDSFIDDLPTLPRLLSTRGYLSLQTGKWWLGSGKRGGFTHAMTHGDPARGGRHGDEGLKIAREGFGVVDDFLDEALEARRPFFVWHAPFLPHTPHNPPERLLARYRERTESLPLAKYWAMCEWFDETCGQLLDLLETKGVAENTVVLYVTDNGWINQVEASRYAPRSKRSPYDGGLRTPILLRWPGRVAPRRDDTTAVSSLDLAPTILRIAGVEVPEAMTGLDLRGAEALRARPRLFGAVFEHDAVDLHDPAQNLQYRWCIEGFDKIVVPHPARVPRGRPELFDLSADPFEERDRAAQRPERLRELRARLDEWWDPGDG